MTMLRIYVSSTVALAALVSMTGCTTLGPVPMVSGQSMAPNPRTNVEAQAAAVPGYYLSSATTDGEGAPQRQLAALFEPGDLLPLEGLSAGGRWVGGGDEGGHIEPMVRYRTAIDEEGRAGVGVVGWGAMHKGSSDEASYEAKRAALEVGTDVRLTPKSHWVEVHWTAALAATAMDASGRYCAGEDGAGLQCGDFGTSESKPNAEVEASGIYPAGNMGIALDFAGRFDGPFHGARVFGMVGGGWMPRVRDGEPADRSVFQSVGLGVQVALGAPAK
jgi:predicted small lipoprotein YifL